RRRANDMQGRRAGIVSRLIADAVDLVAVVVWYVVLLSAFAVVRFLLTSSDLRLPRPGSTFNVIALFVVQVVYLGIGWSGTTRTDRALSPRVDLDLGRLHRGPDLVAFTQVERVNGRGSDLGDHGNRTGELHAHSRPEPFEVVDRRGPDVPCTALGASA